MGVTGLLPLLGDIQTKGTLERYRGKTLAIDTYGWLHRATYSCARELCLDQPTRRYITSVMNKVQMLKHFEIEPYFVFDGSSLPTKAATNAERKKNRDEAKLRAESYVKQGKSGLAHKEYTKACSVTSQMVKSLLIEFEKFGIKYIIAPYEADPQMVYLEKIGLCDGILSEDSDLLIFGCNTLITKIKDDGTCTEINRKDFGKVKAISGLNDFTRDELHLVAMLSGCDYTKGIPNVGILTAFKVVKKYRSYDRVLTALRYEKKEIPKNFADEYIKANLAFKYQKVFDPRSNKLCPLNEYPENFDVDLDLLESCCGNEFNNDIWLEICTGRIDPRTHETLISREQILGSLRSTSVNSAINAQPTLKTNSTILNKKVSVLDYFAASKVSATNNNGESSNSSISSKSESTTSTAVKPDSKITSVSSNINLSARTTLTSHANKRSVQSPTSKKLQRITSSISGTQGKISSFFSKVSDQKPIQKPELKQLSMPNLTFEKPKFDNDSEFIDEKPKFDDDSEFTDEFSSPIKKSDDKVQNQVTDKNEFTDSDEIDTSMLDEGDIHKNISTPSLALTENDIESSKSLFVNEDSSFEDMGASFTSKSVDQSPPGMDLESDLDEIESSPVKISNPTGKKVESEIFKYCHSLRLDFLFDSNKESKIRPTLNLIPKKENGKSTEDYTNHNRLDQSPIKNIPKVKLFEEHINTQKDKSTNLAYTQEKVKPRSSLTDFAFRG